MEELNASAGGTEARPSASDAARADASRSPGGGGPNLVPKAQQTLTAAYQREVLRVASLKEAGEVRKWASGSGQESLVAMLRGVRELHSSWLHADAALINLQVENSLLKSAAADDERTAARKQKDDECELASRLRRAEAALAASEGGKTALASVLAERDAEIAQLTFSLQQSILDRAAEVSDRIAAQRR